MWKGQRLIARKNPAILASHCLESVLLAAISEFTERLPKFVVEPRETP